MQKDGKIIHFHVYGIDQLKLVEKPRKCCRPIQ